MDSLLSRITLNPEICHGKPVIRNMRWPVEVILDMLAGGMSADEIFEDHPELEKEDVRAALRFAKLAVSGRSLAEAV